MLDPALLDALRARLDASRAALLASLEGVTDRDFGVDIGRPDAGGETVVQALATLASDERHATAAVAGETVTDRVVERPLPPQVVHALASARYRTRRYLESAEADPQDAEALVAGLEARDATMAEHIRQRPRLAPPPVFPMVEPQGPQPGEPPRSFSR